MDPNILLFFSVSAIIAASPSQDANQAALTAYAKQSGIEQTLQDYQKKYVPKQVEIYIGRALILEQLMFERKIQFKWTF